MQLNPSTDFYDDDDDEEEEDDGFYDEDVEADDDQEEPETLPEAKSLVQEPAKRSYDDEEEEDMGYDEDDERIAIAVERPRLARPSAGGRDDDFMNEEGSGRTPLTLTGYKHNLKDRLRLEHQLGDSKYRHKQQKLLTESANSDDGVDAREGSGNFANDDEDDNDDDDDDDDDGDDDGVHDDDDEGDAATGGGFFNGQRKKGAGNRRRYFRKNTNDAIKIISTPLGKVGIVYQQTPNQDDDLQLKEDQSKKSGSTSFTDFDALSPDPASSHRLASSHPKITPVLTADGKVALLYRGDSENSKYEPIRNLTHKFNTNTDNTPGLNNSGGTSSGSDEEDDSNSAADIDTDNDSAKDGESNYDNEAKNVEQTEAKIIADPDLPLENGAADSVSPTKGSFIIRPTDSVLPMINRPLSEVLGIKKNQFKQFRIKDQPTTTINPLRQFIGADQQQHNHQQQQQQNSDTTTLHFLTKVNLADYPTSARTRNFDFDFSRDNTMLDERTRHPPPQDTTQETQGGSIGGGGGGANEMNTIANEEILSKTEVVNLAIVPHFDEDLERLQQLHDHESRRRLRQRHRQRQSDEDLSGTHCIMQAMMGIAAISTVFGMLGTFFKQRILDQIRLMHW